MFVGRLCKPPSRKKFEEDVAQCNSAIQLKESQLVSIFILHHYGLINYNGNYINVCTECAKKSWFILKYSCILHNFT